MLKWNSLILFIGLILSCGGRQTTASQEQGDTLVFKYATQLSIVKYPEYTEVSLHNPWKEGMTLHKYILISDSSVFSLHSSLPEGTVIRTPLKRAVMFTTVHCAMLMDFQKQDCISGVADLKYIKIPWIQQPVREGHITDVGDGMSPVIEKIIDEHPDALFLSPFENSGGYGKLDELDIPIVECADYMESSPLARAEWLRFYGMLFGCEQRADSLFEVIDKNYHQLKALAATAKTKPTVLMDKVTGSVWYVPGGRSTIGQMIQDANGLYPWASDDHSGSVSLPSRPSSRKLARLIYGSSDTVDNMTSPPRNYWPSITATTTSGPSKTTKPTAATLSAHLSMKSHPSIPTGYSTTSSVSFTLNSPASHPCAITNGLSSHEKAHPK